MTMAKCWKCEDFIMTPEHLEDKKKSACKVCVMREFDQNKMWGNLTCKRCGKDVTPTLRDTNIHLNSGCSQSSEDKKNG